MYSHIDPATPDIGHSVEIMKLWSAINVHLYFDSGAPLIWYKVSYIQLSGIFLLYNKNWSYIGGIYFCNYPCRTHTVTLLILYMFFELILHHMHF